MSPTLFTYARDTVLLGIGAAIFLRQGGIFWPPPEEISVPLLAVAALLCNVPGAIQLVNWRFGRPTDSPSSPSEPHPPVLPAVPLPPGSSSGGD